MPRRDALLLAGIVLLSVGLYLAVSAFYYRIGFPLDDAWIHQTYARNLAVRGEWAFVPGQPSGGSTAPLWSALLAVGFWLHLAPYFWTYLLGTLTLGGLAFLGETTARRLVASYRPRFPWAGAALALEWHLVWAAVSGMETLLYAFLSTAVLVMLIARPRKCFGLGLLIGLSVWVRPDGVTLLAPAVLVLLLDGSGWRERGQRLFNLLLGFGGLFALYLLFNLLVAGSPWPNTFYAKQAEYAAYLTLPIFQRLGSELLQPLVGFGVLLLPGFVLTLVSAIRRRAWGVLAAAAWCLGFLALYALRLPVTYQHGRYVIPAMPVYFILGLAGLLEFVREDQPHWRWFVVTFWKLATGLTLLAFCGYGAYRYAQDVAIIESEMVTTAKWVSANIPPEALVAAHDIGALGYFGDHNLVDLAGLVSPEVIPFIRDEQRIAAYLDERGVQYLVTFPDWYPSLTSGLTPVFTTGAPYSPLFGETNMTVYEWPRR